jgi:hypothetical protein
MPVLKNTIVLFCLIAVTTIAVAQNIKPVKANTATAQKFKQPKLKSALGSRTDSAVVSVDEAIQLVTLPIVITDDKKISYPISSYQCMYKRKGVTEDEVSGKVSPASSMVINLFKTTPLPELWKKIISEQLQPGEEIFFFDIVVKDTQGHLMFAPNIKLVTQ